MATLLHGKDSKDSNVAIWRYMARMRKEERMQKGARQWCIIPVPQSASATFSLAASKMSICPDQKSETFPAQKMEEECIAQKVSYLENGLKPWL